VRPRRDKQKGVLRRRVPDIFDTNAKVLEFQERCRQTGGSSVRSYCHRAQSGQRDTLPWKGSAKKRILGISDTSAIHLGLPKFRRRTALHNVHFDLRRVNLQQGTLLVMGYPRRKIPGICGTNASRFAHSFLSSIILLITFLFCDALIRLKIILEPKRPSETLDRVTPGKGDADGCHRISSLSYFLLFLRRWPNHSSDRKPIRKAAIGKRKNRNSSEPFPPSGET
jgi:hypothetical protein